MIAMCCHDSEENERSEYTYQTLYSLRRTVDLHKHRLFVIDNNSCRRTKEMLELMSKERHHKFTVITMPENVGTAGAINQAWKHKRTGENLIKMDNDCVIHSSGWVDEMDRAIERDPNIGIIGLKRKDLIENPWRNDDYKSELVMLPHKDFEPWIVVEKVKHVIGTCQMYSAALIEKIGYLYQPSLYGYDDVLASYRSQVAKFYNCFLPHIEIEHIDNRETPYWQWKRNEAAKGDIEHQRTVHEYLTDKRSIYYNPYEM